MNSNASDTNPVNLKGERPIWTSVVKEDKFLDKWALYMYHLKKESIRTVVFFYDNDHDQGLPWWKDNTRKKVGDTCWLQIEGLCEPTPVRKTNHIFVEKIRVNQFNCSSGGSGNCYHEFIVVHNRGKYPYAYLDMVEMYSCIQKKRTTKHPNTLIQSQTNPTLAVVFTALIRLFRTELKTLPNRKQISEVLREVVCRCGWELVETVEDVLISFILGCWNLNTRISDLCQLTPVDVRQTTSSSTISRSSLPQADKSSSTNLHQVSSVYRVQFL